MSKPDPQKAREVAAGAWQAVSSGDVAALETFCRQDLVWHASGRSVHAGDHRGRDAVLGYLAGVGEDVERFDLELEDVLVGDTGAVMVMRARGRRGERVLDAVYLVRLRFDEGRIAEVWSVALDQPAVDAFWA
jgi:ketosteroid isomerase-like protein